MAFFNSAVTVLQTLVIALGAGLCIWGVIMDRISYDSYKINIESTDLKRDISTREVYGIDTSQAE